MKVFKLSAIILLLVTFQAAAQPLKLSLTVGLNSVGVSDADGVEKTVYVDDAGFPQLGVVETKGAVLLPPLRLEANYWLNEKLFVGTSFVFQSYQESATLRDIQGAFISTTQRNQSNVFAFGELGIQWLEIKSFNFISGVGLGYGWSTYKDDQGNNEAGFCFDVRPITIEYKLCCGWALFLDTRYTSSPKGLDKAAGYMVGLGASYSF